MIYLTDNLYTYNFFLFISYKYLFDRWQGALLFCSARCRFRPLASLNIPRVLPPQAAHCGPFKFCAMAQRRQKKCPHRVTTGSLNPLRQMKHACGNSSLLLRFFFASVPPRRLRTSQALPMTCSSSPSSPTLFFFCASSHSFSICAPLFVKSFPPRMCM